MQHKPRTLTICRSPSNDPKLTLEGLWLAHWGFRVCDIVSVTRTEFGDILIKTIIPAEKARPMKIKKQMEAAAKADLQSLDSGRFRRR